MLSEYHKCVFSPITWMVGPIMNLISGTHHSCKRREHVFMVLREYTIISQFKGCLVDALKNICFIVWKHVWKYVWVKKHVKIRVMLFKIENICFSVFTKHPLNDWRWHLDPTCRCHWDMKTINISEESYAFGSCHYHGHYCKVERTWPGTLCRSLNNTMRKDLVSLGRVLHYPPHWPIRARTT